MSLAPRDGVVNGKPEGFSPEAEARRPVASTAAAVGSDILTCVWSPGRWPPEPGFRVATSFFQLFFASLRLVALLCASSAPDVAVVCAISSSSAHKISSKVFDWQSASVGAQAVTITGTRHA
jgi:hypothetical protein